MKDLLANIINKLRLTSGKAVARYVFWAVLFLGLLFFTASSLFLWRYNVNLMNTEKVQDNPPAVEQTQEQKSKKKKDPVTAQTLQEKQNKLNKLLEDTKSAK